jgi:hypothetical protein
MKIKTVTSVQAEIVETDDSFYPTYRRNSVDNWEQLMGESWEPVYDSDKLEKAYQEWKQ